MPSHLGTIARMAQMARPASNVRTKRSTDLDDNPKRPRKDLARGARDLLLFSLVCFDKSNTNLLLPVKL